MTTLSAAQSVDIAQLSRDLFSQIISVNGTYLTISVSIILGSGLVLTILMYLLNFKPMKQSLDKQAEDIKEIKKETEFKVEDLKKSHNEVCNSIQNLRSENKNILENLKSVSKDEIESVKNLFKENQKTFDERMKFEIELKMKEVDLRFLALEKDAIEKIVAIERDNRILDLKTTWDMHYVWINQGVPVNAFSSIVATLEKTIDFVKKYNNSYVFYFELSLKKLPSVIDSLLATDLSIFIGVVETVNKLESCLSLIQGYEIEKQNVITKIKELRKILGLNN